MGGRRRRAEKVRERERGREGKGREGGRRIGGAKRKRREIKEKLGRTREERNDRDRGKNGGKGERERGGKET